MVTRKSRAVAGLVGSALGMMGLLLSPTTAAADPTGAQARLAVVSESGTGSGQVLIAPTARDHGTFAVEITINLHGASPDRVYTITRFPDTNANGVCTGTEVTIPPVTLATSAGGAGATHFSLERGAPFLSGISFDVYFQLAGSDGSVLQSECVTVTVK